MKHGVPNGAVVARTRFAPSPTGYLHIGGARTALFNYLLARKLGGKFVLRIEDTDQTRNIEAADAKLMEDLRWLGLAWDEGPEVGGVVESYYQSRRLARYEACSRALLDGGHAYYAWDTPEELAAMRAAALRDKRSFRYPRPASFPSESAAKRARAEGRPVVIRLKMPDRDMDIPDQILGTVHVAATELDDLVLVKSDGWPTYNFAVVVDDADMAITHVLRGQEHLLNTPKQMAIQDYLGFRRPMYGHLPLILEMDGSKMSKRRNNNAVRAALAEAISTGAMHDEEARRIAAIDAETYALWKREDTNLAAGPLGRLSRAMHVALHEIEVHDFRVQGYLPEVIVNFIALLGWNPGDDREKLTMADLCELFSLERINKANARFDRDKLLNFNTTALASAPAERKLAALRDYVSVNPDSALRGLDDATLARLIEICPGVRTLRDIETKTASLFAPDERFEYDAKAVKDVLLKGDGGGLRVLRSVRDELASLADWSPPALEALLRGASERMGVGLGKVAQPLRVATTGGMVSPPLFDTLALLGKARALARINRALVQAR